METNGAHRLPPTEKMGPRIRRLRKRLDLTQAQLGDLVGVKELAVGDWERGKYEPRGENLIALADALGVPPHYIMYGEAGVYRDAVEKIAAIVDEVRGPPLNPTASTDASASRGRRTSDEAQPPTGEAGPETKSK